MQKSVGRLIAAALLAAPTTIQAAAEPAAPFAPPVAACFAAQAARVPFDGLVYAARGGEEYFQTAGTIDGSAAPRRDTPYSLASVGKVFTQVAIGQLVDQGRVTLDAPIGTYLQGLPPEIAAVTVAQLLQHRSGVRGNIMFTPESAAAMRRARTARELLPMVVSQPLAFPPGSRTEYSNGGYFLLGAIVEAVSGLDYPDYLEQRIFRPLGMTGSRAAADARTAPSMSRMRGPGGPPLERPAAMPAAAIIPGNPAGDSVSTADDLARLARALLGERLLSAATKARLFARPAGGWRAGQAGGRPGANTYLMVYPESGSLLVVLSNYDPPGAELMGMVLGRLLAGQPCTPLSESDQSPMRRPPPEGQPHA